MTTPKLFRAELKLLVIGCSGTGKTSFVSRWTTGEFVEVHKPTIVSEFGFKEYQYKGNFYKIQIWDIGGHDKSPSIAKLFSRDSHGCVVLCDVKKPGSIEDTMNWKKVVNDESEFIDGGKLPFVLVQNKIDLIAENDDLKKAEERTKEICDKNEIEKYFMVSVKENKNVDEVMEYLIGNIIERLEKYATASGQLIFSDQQRRGTVKLKKNKSLIIPKDKNCC